MRMKILSTIAAVAALTLPATANAGVTLVKGTTFNIPTVNDFKSQLNALGLTQYTTTGADLFVDSTSTILFEFLGSESGFSDTFAWDGSSPNFYTENTAFTNNFASPLLIGASVYTPGSLAGRLTFTSTNPGGVTTTVGGDGFGIFLGPNQTNGPVSTFYLGFDDQITNQDDNHDDFIVRATVLNGAVPEPATWAMMLFGFGGVGFAMRRRKGEGGKTRIRFAHA